MPYKIDRFTFSDQTVDNFQRVGITPDKIESWITDGRNNGVSDAGIRDFITDQFHELNNTAEKERGRNIAGGIRHVVSKIPVVGNWADEGEALVRSAIGSKSYDEYLQNARDSLAGAKQAFKENTENGNWFDRNIGKHAPTALNVIGNVGLATATGGATLMPNVALAQGAIEGYGDGTDTASRAINAALHGGINYGVTSVLNKILPTKEIAQKTVNKAAKGELLGNSKPYSNVIAKSIKSGEEPVSVIAKESTRATEPAILKNMQMALKGNDAQAKVVYDSAVRNIDYDGGFVKYIKDRMPSNLSAKVADRLTKGFAALENGFESAVGNTDDVLVKENLPQMIDAVINTAMRGASTAERGAVKQAAIKAFTDRHFAKEIVKRLIPQNMIGNIGNQASMIRPDRVFSRPISNMLNAGTLRTMTNALPTVNILGKTVGGGQSQIPTATRAVLDALIK